MTYMIAVVEDDRQEATLLRGHLLTYGIAHQIDFQISLFSNAEDFLARYKPIYDLVFLDIALPGINGMEAAAKLREMDQVVTLIFITSMAQYAVNGYEVQAFDFILKPVPYPTFVLKMQRALNRVEQNHDSEIIVTLGTSITRVRARSIRYIEISKHDMLIHTGDAVIPAYGNLKQMEVQLDPRFFVRCNSCYLVNLSFVQSIQGMTVTVGSDELQISRPRRRAFVEALNNYLGGGI